MPPPAGTIKHLVVLMLENRSFDHMFGFMKSDTYPIDGLNGDECNLDPNGVKVTVSPDANYSGDLTVDPGHHFPDVNIQLFGNIDGEGDPVMSGFVKDYAQMGGSNPTLAHNIMKCFSPGPVPPCKIPILMTLAEQYAVCDRWFASVPGPTLPNRSYAHAATSVGRVDMNPIWYEEGKTIYELLAESKVTSKIFFHDMTVAMTFKNFLKNQSYFGTFDDFLDACDSNKLPSYSFVEPRYNADNVNHLGANDQHPDHDIAEGETLIQDVYKAVSKNKDVWNSTILLIVYDEHGGLYDHVPPPATVNPDGKNSTNPFFDFMRLGLRVPAVVISPWIPPQTIDHLQYDHASIAATARKLFLGAEWETKFLTARDQIANTFERNLSLDQPRQGTVDFSAPHKNAALARVANTPQVDARTAQNAAQPLSDLQKSLVAQAHFVNQHGLPADLGPDTNPDQIATAGQAAAFHAAVTKDFLAPKVEKATP
jgi:phospholipase C